MKPPDEVKRELVQQWLAKAEEDFGVACHLMEDDSPYLNAIGFHAQQAAEKYLKMFLVHHQVEFPKTHNLGELLDLIGNIDVALAEELRDLTILNPYGADIRYPGDRPEMTPEMARAAVELARKARTSIRQALGITTG